MPRYHLKVRGSDVPGIKKAVAGVAVKVQGRGGEVTVTVDAKSAVAAKKMLVSHLPKGSDAAVVGRTRLIRD